MVVGRTTVSEMVRRYRAAGFDVSSVFIPTFLGTFVDVRRRDTRKDVIGGFGDKVVEMLVIPYVPRCH